MKTEHILINIEREIDQAVESLSSWRIAEAVQKRILESWKESATQWNAANAIDTASADGLENALVEEFRHDPLELVRAIMENPITRKRVLEEDCAFDLTLARFPKFHTILASRGLGDWAATFFERLARKIRRKNIGAAKSTKHYKHPDWALHQWLRPIFPCDPQVPPNCLLDNKSLALTAGLPFDMRPSAIRTAISNWGLARPPVKDRLALPKSYQLLLENRVDGPANLADRLVSELLK